MDKHICSLLLNNFDLKDYLESNLPIYQIKSNSFIDQSTDRSTHYFAINTEFLVDIKDSYELIKSKINEDQKE